MLLVLHTVIAIILIAWYFVSHKLVSDAEKSVIQSWTTLDLAHRQREDFARQLLDFGETHRDLEKAWLRAVETNFSPEQADAITMKTYASRQHALDLVLKALITATEPPISPDTNAKELRRQYREIQQQIQAASREYDHSLNAYNKQIEQFPINLLAFSEKAAYPKL